MKYNVRGVVPHCSDSTAVTKTQRINILPCMSLHDRVKKNFQEDKFGFVFRNSPDEPSDNNKWTNIQIPRVINSQQHKENMKTEILITLGKKPERQGKHALV